MRVEEKVPGGKLVRLEFSKGKIVLSGDFFLHPEDSLEEIEWILTDYYTRGEQGVEDRLLDLVKEKNIQMIGFTPMFLGLMLERLKGMKQ